MVNPWKKSRKIKNRHNIINTLDESVHPKYKNALTVEETNEVLQELSSFTVVEVSARVKGRCGIRPIFGCKFVPLF